MNNNTYKEFFTAMDCDNDFAVNSTEFQTAFNGKVFTVIIFLYFEYVSQYKIIWT